jgi:hypothetical protein
VTEELRKEKATEDSADEVVRAPLVSFGLTDQLKKANDVIPVDDIDDSVQISYN